MREAPVQRGAEHRARVGMGVELLHGHDPRCRAGGYRPAPCHAGASSPSRASTAPARPRSSTASRASSRARGRPVTVLREPGGVELSERIRDAGQGPGAARRPARRGAALRGGARAARRPRRCCRAWRPASGCCSTASSTPRSPTRAAGGRSASTSRARSTTFATGGLRARPHAAAAHRPRGGPGARRRPRRGGRPPRARGGARSSPRSPAAYDALAAAEPERFAVLDARAAQPEPRVLGARARGARAVASSRRSPPGAPAPRPRRRRSSSRARACAAPSRARGGSSSLAATSCGGSPGRRGLLARRDRAAGHARGAASITSRTEKPVPLPRL